jgi:transposase InsO family protein
MCCQNKILGLLDGARSYGMTVVDAYTREALAIDVDQGIRGEQVVEAMDRIATIRATPWAIRVDNGPEFISKALDRWAYENGVTRDFSRPGKPAGNVFVESFNGRISRQMPEHPLVLVSGRRQEQDRRAATGITTSAVLTHPWAG